MVRWLGICLTMQGTYVQSLVRELRSHMPVLQLLSPRDPEPITVSLCAETKDPHGATKILRATAKNGSAKCKSSSKERKKEIPAHLPSCTHP